MAADGVSIPSSYTSHIAPLMSAKLHAEVEDCRLKEKVKLPSVCLSVCLSAHLYRIPKHLFPIGLLFETSVIYDTMQAYLLAHYETPYVVRMWNAMLLSSPQKCFTFHHPNHGMHCVSTLCIVCVEEVWLCKRGGYGDSNHV